MYENGYKNLHYLFLEGIGRVNYHKRFKQKLKIIFFYQKYVHVFENTVITCSQITVIHVHVIIFVYNSRSCHNYAQEVIKMADQNAAA